MKPSQNQMDYHDQDIMRTYQEKQRHSLNMVAKPAGAAESSPDAQKQLKDQRNQRLKSMSSQSNQTRNKGYFLYESLRDPEKKNDTKIVGDILTGTLNQYNKHVEARLRNRKSQV